MKQEVDTAQDSMRESASETQIVPFLLAPVFLLPFVNSFTNNRAQSCIGLLPLRKIPQTRDLLLPRLLSEQFNRTEHRIMNNDMINKVESLKLMLVSRATGGLGDDIEYKNLRRELTTPPRISKLLPRFVHVCRDLSEFWSFIKAKFGSYAERREYLREEFDLLLTMLETESRTPSDAPITATAQSVSSTYIQEAWHKALERRATDPEGAITAARTLLESVCKHILDAAGATYDDSADLPKLYSLTAKQLNLSPSQHTEQLFKQILGGCQTVVEGVGALRNRHRPTVGTDTGSERVWLNEVQGFLDS